MDEIWLESPSPALRFWGGGDGVSFRPNSAAAAWGRRLKLGDAAWQAIAAELSACCLDRGHGQGRLSSAAADWRSLPMSGGWLVWLSTEKQYADHESVWGTLTDKLELIQEFGRLGLFERDLKTDVGRWDAHMFRLFEFEPADGTPTFEQTCSRVHPEDVAKFRSWHECLRDQAGRHSLSFRLVLPEGVQRDLHAHIEIRVDATGRPDVLLGVAFDETKSASRVRAEQAVSRHLSTALRLARISVWHIDLQQQWISLNDVGFEMAGLELQAGGLPIGTVRRLAHPDDVLRLERAGAQAFASQAVVDLEARYLNPDGSGYRRLLTRRVAERDASGAPVGLLGVSLEQTDRIVERERAQALAQRIEIVTNTAGVGVYSVDLRTGEIEWNRQMFSIHGLPEDARAPSFDTMAREIVHPDDRAQFVRSRLQYDEIEGACESEVRIVHPDGAVRSVEFRSRRDRVGDRWFVLGIAIDVTERVMQRAIAERSLREKEAAEHASAAKSEFLARMSHELRTPLNAVLGFAQLIEHEAHAAPFGVQLERVARIRQAGERLLTLVGDVLERVNQEELTDSVSPDAGMRDAATAQVTQPDNGAARLSVLYIEDNPVNVILVEELVAMRANTTLNCAADGLTGVACAAASRPDVVLVDMQLPDIDGFEVLRRLRELRGLEGSAIIALSANGISEDIALARAAGFDDYWTKPIDFQHFLRGLDHLAALRC